jgi:beta-lactamase regulating signal transducer with metallopeptidase domain
MSLLMTMVVNLDFLAAAAAERTLAWIASGLAIAIFAEILLRLDQRQNSRTRFVVWFAALLGIAFLPLTSFLFLKPHAQGIGSTHSNFTLPAEWAVYVFLAWGLVALIGLLRVGIGFVHISKLRKRSVEVNPSSLDAQLQQRLGAQTAGRKVRVYECADLRVPIAVGFVRPAIILPSWTLRGLSRSELNGVILHEMAHIRRWDDWTNLLQKVVSAIFFFHPAVWWIENRLTLEREMACDDVVVSESSDPREYANCLVSLAEKSVSRRGFGLAQAAVKRVRDISSRITRILDSKRGSRITLWKPALGLVAVFSVLSSFASLHIPQLISFSDQAPASHASFRAPRPLQIASSKEVLPTRPNVDRQAPSLLNASLRSSERVTRGVAQKPVQLQQKPLLQGTSAPGLSATSSVRLAKATAARAKVANSSQAYFLVIRTNYSDDGEVFWSVGVVHLTLFHPSSAQTQPHSSQQI